MNSRTLALMGPGVFRATGKKLWVPLRELYFVVFLAAAVSAALALVMAQRSAGDRRSPKCRLFIYLMDRIHCTAQ